MKRWLSGVTRVPFGVAPANRDRRHDCFVHEDRTFWNVLSHGREGGSAHPVQKRLVQGDTVVGEESPLVDTPAAEPVPENAKRSGDVGGHRNRCCGSEDGTWGVVTAHGSADVRGVAQESVVRGVEAGGSHGQRRNPAVTCAQQILCEMAGPLGRWARLILGLGARLGQKSHGYCQMGGRSRAHWRH